MPCSSSQSGASSATTIAGSQSGEYRRVGSISGRAAFQVAASPATPATSNENAPPTTRSQGCHEQPSDR